MKIQKKLLKEDFELLQKFYRVGKNLTTQKVKVQNINSSTHKSWDILQLVTNQGYVISFEKYSFLKALYQQLEIWEKYGKNSFSELNEYYFEISLNSLHLL